METGTTYSPHTGEIDQVTVERALSQRQNVHLGHLRRRRDAVDTLRFFKMEDKALFPW